MIPLLALTENLINNFCEKEIISLVRNIFKFSMDRFFPLNRKHWRKSLCFLQEPMLSDKIGLCATLSFGTFSLGSYVPFLFYLAFRQDVSF